MTQSAEVIGHLVCILELRIHDVLDVVEHGVCAGAFTCFADGIPDARSGCFTGVVMGLRVSDARLDEAGDL